ncbi:MAG: hypothetical protein JWN33_441 [Candidatus Saccharibacteria bacterium]|nr:hypothetical protein [Candidatus Saccharibacteria bacterium]
METERQKRKNDKLQEAFEVQKQARDAGWPVQHWRAWGSWFSWGSPVGLGLFFALTLISLGLFIWLINL